MLIRSQKKGKIVNLNNIDTLTFKTDKNMFLINSFNGMDDSETVLGVYSSRNQVIEIFDRICEEYQYSEQCKNGYNGEQVPIYVFQMPDDNKLI